MLLHNVFQWRAFYYGWNMHPRYPDQFGDPWRFGSNETERIDWYLARCLPNIEQIALRLSQVRKDWKGKLSRVYVLGNADKDFEDQLRLRLYSDGWERVTFTREMIITKDEVEIDVAADMMIAEHAEVFIGNGVSRSSPAFTRLYANKLIYSPSSFSIDKFSSLTSNVNILRMARDVNPESIRFW